MFNILACLCFRINKVPKRTGPSSTSLGGDQTLSDTHDTFLPREQANSCQVVDLESHRVSSIRFYVFLSEKPGVLKLLLAVYHKHPVMVSFWTKLKTHKPFR